MNKVLKNSWALFLGMGAIILAYGFQGSLLGVRAVKEEFSITATGFMMSGYFVGYFLGAITIPRLISQVGHIRIYAAFASIASLVILLHAIFVNPLIWFLLRVLTGISMVSIFLNVGGFLLVSKIGIKAPDVIIDINIKGSKFIGLLKFKKNIPIPIEPYRITI